MPEVVRLHLATALAIAPINGEPCALLVASAYPNQMQPLWNLPGGRQRPGELLCETAERECFEETHARVRAGELAYVSESYDGATHVLNATFLAGLESAAGAIAKADDEADHIVDVAWVRLSDVASRIAVAVVRDPLMAYLEGRLTRRYAGFHHADITIRWPDDAN